MELYQIIDMDCGFVMNFCVVYLVKPHNHFVKCNIIQKLPYKVKYISQINESLIMFFANSSVRFL